MAAWTPGTTYLTGQTATYNGSTYVCLSDHSSSDLFPKDLDSRWTRQRLGETPGINSWNPHNPTSLGPPSSAVIGPWTARSEYQPGQVVISSGAAYVAIDDHASGSSFAGDLLAHWNLLSGTGIANTPAPSGGDDTAAVLASAVNNTIKLGAGTYQLALGTLPRFDIEGLGPDVTFIQPASATDPIVKGGGAGNKTDDRARLAHLSLVMTANRLYANPLIDFSMSRNVTIEDVRADVDTRVGTIFRFNAAYQFVVREVHIRGGKWIVPGEFVNTDVPPGFGGPPQCDTMRVEQFQNDGCNGWIFRNANNDVHGIGLDGYKIVQTNFYPTPPSQETTLAGAHSAAAGTLTVTAGTGIVANDVLTISPGRDTCEIVKVDSIIGTTVTLNASTPLRYAHADLSEVLRGGFCLSIADGYENITINRWHSEGQQIGAALGNVRGVEFIEPYFGCGQHIRVCDATREVNVRRPTMWGTVNKNELLRRSSNIVSSTDDRWVCEDPIVPAGASITPTVTSGYFPHGTRTWSWTGLLNGVRATVTNAQTASAGAKLLVTGLNGANGQGSGDKAWLTHGGQGVFLDGARTLAKAGPIADGDFLVTPSDGHVAVDTTNTITWVRAGGSWIPQIDQNSDARRGSECTTGNPLDGPGSIAVTTGTVYAALVFCKRGGVFTRMRWGIGSAGSAVTNMRGGVWDNTSGALLAATTDQSASYVQTTVIDTGASNFTVTILPNTYVRVGLGIVGTSPSFRGWQGIAAMYATTGVGAGQRAFTIGGFTTTLPSLGASPSTTGNVPWVELLP